jgi:hypothetical protein
VYGSLYRRVLTFSGRWKSVFVIVISAIGNCDHGAAMIVLPSNIRYGSSVLLSTTGYKWGCHLLTFSNRLQHAVFFSFAFSTDPLCVLNFYNFTPTLHHVATIWLDVCAQCGCSSHSVIKVMVAKTLCICSTAVWTQGVLSYLRVTVSLYRPHFQLLCPCGELYL